MALTLIVLPASQELIAERESRVCIHTCPLFRPNNGIYCILVLFSLEQKDKQGLKEEFCEGHERESRCVCGRV